MPSLLVATASHLLRYDLTERQTYVLETGKGSYYGISWFPGSERLFTTHSGGLTVDLNSAQDYMKSERGYLSDGARSSQSFLSNPHQIRCLDYPYIAATNTGRNALAIVNVDDWSVRQHWFDDIHWDRYDPSGRMGSHFNSVEASGDRFHLLAHNFNFGSYELVLQWPDLEVIERHQYETIQLHNLWLRDDGMKIACDSARGGLIDLSNGQICWSSGSENSYTRGLACDGRNIFVGSSERSDRADRDMTSSRVWVVDNSDFRTLDLLDLGRFGAVQEVRLVDVLDDCHRVGAFAGVAGLAGTIAGSAVADQAADLKLTQALIANNRRQPMHDAGMTSVQIFQRERDEAIAHFNRLEGEVHDRMAERDIAVAERDEVQRQYERVVGELEDRIRERDSATTERDEALVKVEIARRELQTAIAERSIVGSLVVVAKKIWSRFR